MKNSHGLTETKKGKDYKMKEGQPTKRTIQPKDEGEVDQEEAEEDEEAKEGGTEIHQTYKQSWKALKILNLNNQKFNNTNKHTPTQTQTIQHKLRSYKGLTLCRGLAPTTAHKCLHGQRAIGKKHYIYMCSVSDLVNS